MATVSDAPPPPNVLFISLDDLNDWVGCLGGHPQARTPNIDRLVRSGLLFTNAHCPAPSCNPSRTAVMTGLPCYQSGLYDNRQRMRALAPAEFAEFIPAKMLTVAQLPWHPAGAGALPESDPSGEGFEVFFHNTSSRPVDIFRVDGEGTRHAYGALERGWFKPYRARAGEVWLVTTKAEEPLGHFVIGAESARATILDPE